MAIPVRTCGDCANAAFSSAGIHCLTFHELIWDETVAVDCGAFTQVSLGAARHWDRLGGTPMPIGEAKQVALALVPKNVRSTSDTEREQVLEARLVLPFYGRDTQGVALAEEVEKTLRLHYPTASLKWD